MLVWWCKNDVIEHGVHCTILQQKGYIEPKPDSCPRTPEKIHLRAIFGRLVKESKTASKKKKKILTSKKRKESKTV